MQAKRMGPGYEIFYDNSGKGDVILRDTRSSNSVIVPQSKLIEIFGNQKSSKSNNDNKEELIKVIDLLQINLIDKSKLIEIYKGSTSCGDLLYDGSVEKFLDNVKKEINSQENTQGTSSYFMDIAKSPIIVIGNEQDITIILIN